MGILDGKCDSCGEEEINFLFPIVIMDELPSGVNKPVTKYYCSDCYDILKVAAEDEANDRSKDKDNNEDEEEDNYSLHSVTQINLTCMGQKYPRFSI